MQNTATPSTFKTPDLGQTATQISKNPKDWFKSNLIRIIIVVLVVAVVAEGAFGAFSLFSPQTARKLNLLQPKVNEMTNAQLSLIPQKKSYKKGDTVAIDVKLYTGGYTTDSTDLVVKYDPSYLKVDGQSFTQVGQIYSEYPGAQVDEKNGLIGVSGITIPGSNGFEGVGEFATLNFKALKDGQTQVSIDYQGEKTSDSNVVLSGSTKDILGSVVNADINIGGSQEARSDQVQSCESFSQYCQNDTGQVGSQVCKAGKMVSGSCSYDPKLTISCEECKI